MISWKNIINLQSPVHKYVQDECFENRTNITNFMGIDEIFNNLPLHSHEDGSLDPVSNSSTSYVCYLLQSSYFSFDKCFVIILDGFRFVLMLTSCMYAFF